MQNRIKELRKSLGLNQTEFGARLGVAQSTVGGWEGGFREVSDAIIKSIVREFGVSESWLRDGTGDMRANMDREEEMGRLLGDLLADRPESFRAALITTLLRFDPNGPEWAVLERIYEDLAKEVETGKDRES